MAGVKRPPGMAGCAYRSGFNAWRLSEAFGLDSAIEPSWTCLRELDGSLAEIWRSCASHPASQATFTTQPRVVVHWIPSTASRARF